MKKLAVNLCMLSLALAVSMPAHGAESATASAQPAYHPSAEAMILDGLLYRPLALAGTIVGTGIFVVTLPFSAAGGNVRDAGRTLVVEPAHEVFGRCLGCMDIYGDGNNR